LTLFERVLKLRHLIVGAFLLTTLAGVYGAARIASDTSIDRLIVAGDPTARATREFERIFPEGEQALILLEAPAPLSAPVLTAAAQLEQKLDAIPHVRAHSLLTLFFRGAPPPQLGEADALRVTRFATGTTLFQRSGLLGDHYLGLGLELNVSSPAQRDLALHQIDELVLPLDARPPFSAVRRVGSPWLDAWLEKQTGESTQKFMPLFGVFLMTLVFLVYRSWRTLLAIILTLGSVVAVGMGLGALFGFSNSVVSTLVPLTVMVTTTATLVYIHSRFTEPATEQSGHHARVLANKFLPCTASMFATAVGFAALAVSEIRPVREMGLWTAAALVVAWLGCFTLFPALQSLLRTPRRATAGGATPAFAAFVDALVPLTRRRRVVLVAAALIIMACGGAALFGVPGLFQPLNLETDALTYVNPHERIAEDTRRFEESNGLDVDELWLKTRPGHALDPDFLHAVAMLGERLEAHAGIDAVDGPTSVLRWMKYIQSGSDQLPQDASAWPRLAGDLEQVLLTEASARAYVDVADLASVRLSIRGRGESFGPSGAMRRFIEDSWASAKAADPAFREVEGQLAGKGVLAGKITERLLPTLTESFAITASVIFCAFLVVFRSPAARLMTMIPSFFAILSVFIVMRFAHIPLNIATILIGSTILGATENDQVHFFYHLQEGGNETSAALRHALITAGRPIIFATLINTSGFLALALSDLPPMRQFGIVSASAFLLALVADFTALPAALWLLRPRSQHHGSSAGRGRLAP
jgi:predicted RND superfamily exporter protein